MKKKSPKAKASKPAAQSMKAVPQKSAEPAKSVPTLLATQRPPERLPLNAAAMAKPPQDRFTKLERITLTVGAIGIGVALLLLGYLIVTV